MGLSQPNLFLNFPFEQGFRLPICTKVQRLRNDNVLLQRWTGNKDNGAELIGLGFKSQQQNQIKSNQTKPNQPKQTNKKSNDKKPQTNTNQGRFH